MSTCELGVRARKHPDIRRLLDYDSHKISLFLVSKFTFIH